MIPTEIVVSFVIAYLVISDVYYRVKCRKLKGQLIGITDENKELRQALENCTCNLGASSKAGPGWTSKSTS